MAIRLNPLDIPLESPFQNCKLEREKYADILTSLVSTYADGFVLAINNKWGTGKTTFVQMWEQKLKNDGFKTLYFNAWENDFENDPLTALMAELKKLRVKKTEASFKKLVDKGAVISRKVAPALLKAMATKMTNKETVNAVIETLIEGSSDLFHEEIESYAKKQDGLIKFKASLTEFVEKTRSNKPIIFIIDELDRCRPNYAVEVLEKVKHFFSVPGIVFVLSIDKTQLGHAIRGVYRSSEMDADEYLRRFIDVEYSIPEPDTKLFCNYLYNYFQMSKFFTRGERTQYGQLVNDGSDLISFTSILFRTTLLPLRVQEKIYAHAKIALNSFDIKSFLLPKLFILLIYYKLTKSELYTGISKYKFRLQELIDEYEKTIPEGLSSNDRKVFAQTEVILILTYFNALTIDPFQYDLELFTIDTHKNNNPTFYSKFFSKSENNYNIIQDLYHLKTNHAYNRISINSIITKINLIEPIMI